MSEINHYWEGNQEMNKPLTQNNMQALKTPQGKPTSQPSVSQPSKEQRRLIDKYDGLLTEMIEDYLLQSELQNPVKKQWSFLNLFKKKEVNKDELFNFYNSKWRRMANNVNHSGKPIRLNLDVFENRLKQLDKESKK